MASYSRGLVRKKVRSFPGADQVSSPGSFLSPLMLPIHRNRIQASLL